MSDHLERNPEISANVFEAAASEHTSIESMPLIEREGLPASYRMRADRHYVDQLAAPASAHPVRMIPVAQIECQITGRQTDLQPLIESIRSHGIVQPLIVRRHAARYVVAAGRKRLIAAQKLRLPAVPCFVQELNDAEAAALRAADDLRIGDPAKEQETGPDVAAAHRLVAGHLAKLRSCADMSLDGANGLNRPAVDLLMAHTWRAAQLLAALDLIAGASLPPHAERALATIVDDVIAGFAAECRLCGVTIRPDVASGLSSSGLDDAQLTAGLAGALMATLPLVQHAVRPTVSIRASGTDTAGVAFEVIQRDVAVPQRLVAGFFEDDPATDRAGGYAAALGARAAKALAEGHGGKAVFEALDHGSRLAMVLARRS